MGTRTRLSSDPQFQQGISNLAKIFAPPSGSDLYGYSKAAESQQTQEARAKYLGMDVNDPQYKKLSDHFAVFEGRNPNYYQIDTNASTDLSKNSADNQRILQTNAADNNRAMAQTRYGAIGQNQVLPALPGSVAGMFNLPESGVVSGNIGVNPGEKVVTPDGREIQGNAKPLSSTEWEAQQAERLRAEGKLNDADLRAKVMGSTPIEEVYDEKTGVPTNVYRTDSLGKPSVLKNTVFDPKTGTYVTSAAPSGKFTERDSVIALAGENMAPGLAILNDAYSGNKSASTGALTIKGLFGDNPAIKDIAQRSGIINEDDQAIMGGINSVMNYLYLQTGAARTPGEDERGYAELVPLASDTPQSRQLKRDMFNQKAMSIVNQAKDPALREKLLQAIQGSFKSPVLNGTPGVSAAPAAPAAPAGVIDFNSLPE
jgi:hypothetical protein